jgi:hypothetical protein
MPIVIGSERGEILSDVVLLDAVDRLVVGEDGVDIELDEVDEVVAQFFVRFHGVVLSLRRDVPALRRQVRS